jgi:hypothetical protein
VARVMLFCGASQLLMLQFIWNVTRKCGVAPDPHLPHVLDQVDVATPTPASVAFVVAVEDRAKSEPSAGLVSLVA